MDNEATRLDDVAVRLDGGAGGSVGGSGIANEMTFWTGLSNIGGDPGLTKSGAGNAFHLKFGTLANVGFTRSAAGVLDTTNGGTGLGRHRAGDLDAIGMANVAAPTVTPFIAGTGSITTTTVAAYSLGGIACVKPATKATGLITCVPKANLLDGETVTITDAVAGAKVYEFDLPPNGVGGGNIVVDVSAATTAASVAAILAPLITANNTGLTVVDNLDGTISLTAKTPGIPGNLTIADTVADATFTHSTVAGINDGILQGETCTVTDASGAVIYVFDFDGTGGGGIVVNLAGAAGAIDVAIALAALIDVNNTDLTVVDNLDGTLSFTAITIGTAGNITIADTVADAGFTHSTTAGVNGILDGETFTLNDGVNPATVFEFNVTGGVTPGRVAVPVLLGDAANTVRDNCITAINGVAATLIITASNGGAATVTLTMDTDGPGAACSETVVAAAFAIAGMTVVPGATTWAYGVTGVMPDGTETLPLATTIVNGAATLNTNHTNHIGWVDVAGVVSFNVYRITAAGVPGTTGKIANVAPGVQALTDNGIVILSATIPTANMTGVVHADNYLEVGTIGWRTPSSNILVAETAAGGTAKVRASKDVDVSAGLLATPRVLTALESGRVITNEGIGAENYNTLPGAVIGLTYHLFCDSVANAIRATASGTDVINLAGIISGAGGYIQSGASGSAVTLTCTKTGTWAGFGATGAWNVV